MENLKIRVNSKSTKKAVKLLKKLGYHAHCKASEYIANGATWLIAERDQYDSGYDYVIEYSLTDEVYIDRNHKEVSLPELRALVSLHKNPINMDKVLSEVRSDALGVLEDEPMKEYLNKLTDGTYKLVVLSDVIDGHDGLIEIPEGAELYVDLGDVSGFYKNNFKQVWDQGNWEDTVYNSENLNIWNKVPALWQRHTQPEELPFVDDEPSINDQYEEIEQVRKEYKLKNDMSVDDYINSLRCEDTINHPPHNHYFIDVSDVDEVDFYEIALRYNVTDPCIQHILKKCLAVGNRGHKDFHTDLKDIYDTAARALRIHGG